MSERTVADVIAEWRASSANNDDGELASRINYYIATQVTPGEIQWAKHEHGGESAKLVEKGEK